MVPALHPKLAQVYRLVELSNKLEKVAASYKDDPEVLTKTLVVKLSVDNQAFDIVKEALDLNALKTLGKPLAWGLGVGAPAVLGGRHLINKFYDRSEEATGDVRNKILQTALGLAAIGGGLYGMHRLTGGAPLGGYPPEKKTEKPAAPKPKEKAASLNTLPEEAIEKLATVGVVEGMLSSLPASTPDETLKLAAEIRVLNRGYGMHLLYEICHE